MYQEKVMVENMDVSAFNNGYLYPPPWNHVTNRHNPPPNLMVMVKQEQELNHYECNNTLMSPISSYHYHPQQDPTMISTTSNGYYTTQNDMCHPLMVDDYASNISSPDLGNGPLLSPTSPTDILSSPSTCSPTIPTIDDQWFGLYSPTVTLQHPPPPSYFVEQRHSIDDAMFFTNNVPKTYLDNNAVDSTCCPYPCNSNCNSGMRGYRMDPAPASSPSLYPSYQHQQQLQQSLMTTRHQSMPTIYQHQHQYAHAAPIESTTTVSDIRPYQCQICDRSFARKHDLQRHIRVHTGDKPYACLCCKKAFARTDALKRHLRMEEICRTSPQIQAMKSSGKRRYKNL